MVIPSGGREFEQPITIERLMNTWFDTVYRLTLSILNDEADAADATQETFIKAARKLPDFRGDSTIKTWLCRIAINESRMVLRRRASRFRMLERFRVWQHKGKSVAVGYPELSAETKGANTALWQAVAQLKEKHRITIILRYAHGLSTAEIASVMAVSEGTVHSRLHYGRHKLLTLLNVDDVEALSIKELR